MARVLIAGLGKGIETKPQLKENLDEDKFKLEELKEYDYKRANYKIKIEDSDEYAIYKNEYFVTSVIEKNYNIDKTIYIGTAGSMWDKLYVHYCEKNGISIDEEIHKNFIKELKDITKNANKNTNIENINSHKFNKIFENCAKKVEILVTKYGVNKTEIFENFNSIIEIISKLDENDEIYLDITHSFRSNAMWIFLVMNYITDVINKNIKIKTITYGMLEEMDDVKDDNGNEIKVASIINLSSFYDFMKWIKGANAFKEYGNSYEFLDMVENPKLKENLKLFSNSMNLNYISSIKKNIVEIKKLEEIIKKLEGPSKLLLPPVLNEFINTIGQETEDYMIRFKLAEWHYKQKRYAMVYVNMIETIYTFASKITGISLSKKNDVNLKIWISEINEANKYKYSSYPEAEINNRIKLAQIFEELKKIRNNISHTLYDESETSEIIAYIEKSMLELKKIFKGTYTLNKTLNEILNKTLKKVEKKIPKNKGNVIEYIKELYEKKFYFEALKETDNYIYDSLYTISNMKESSDNKIAIMEWLQGKNTLPLKISAKELEKERIWIAQMKNKIKKINDKKNEMKDFLNRVEKIEKILNSEILEEKNKEVNKKIFENDVVVKNSAINNNLKEIRMLSSKKLTETEKNELKRKYKISKFLNFDTQFQKMWDNVNLDEKYEGNLQKIKNEINRIINIGDYLFLEGEIGYMFSIVTWSKQKKLIPIYSFLKVDKEVVNQDGVRKIIKKMKHIEFKKY